jgi:translation initiation factor 1 (eIF-1/SUI1)
MKEKNVRMNDVEPGLPLTSNPFAQLLGGGAETPAPAPPAAKKPAPAFHVEKTRKGGYPIFVEKRSAGKSVTVIRNISGDAEALFTLLKKRCAAGGKAFADSVEIQGDHRAKVEALLREMGL